MLCYQFWVSGFSLGGFIKNIYISLSDIFSLLYDIHLKFFQFLSSEMKISMWAQYYNSLNVILN